MSIDLNDLKAPTSGTAFDFKTVGDEIEGVLVDVGAWRAIEGKFGTRDKSPWNIASSDGEVHTIWVPRGSRLATVLGDAIRDAGLTAVVTGGVLKVRRVEDVPTDRGAMHDFKAKYTPAATAGPALDDF